MIRRGIRDATAIIGIGQKEKYFSMKLLCGTILKHRNTQITISIDAEVCAYSNDGAKTDSLSITFNMAY